MSPVVSFDAHSFETPLAESQACRHQDFLHRASGAETHLPKAPADLAAALPRRPGCQIRCGDTAELSLRMVSCKSAISFPSVLIFFQGFFSLLAWHAYICLISLDLALRFAFPGHDSKLNFSVGVFLPLVVFIIVS